MMHGRNYTGLNLIPSKFVIQPFHFFFEHFQLFLQRSITILFIIQLHLLNEMANIEIEKINENV